jgi:peptidyl-tRNA hydrolase, PTH1 family
MTDLLAVGLGNPGPEYVGTRHNVGFEVIELLAERHGGKLRRARRQHSLADEVRVGTQRLALAQPQTFMNDSGRAVAPLVRHYGIDDVERLVVVHDELDLPVGRLKVKQGGGLAGHNGLRSIKAHLHDDGFVRVRIGVGKPPSKEEGVGHVLNRPPKAVRLALADMVERAADAVEAVLADGVEAAMNRFNALPDAPPGSTTG